MNGAPHAHVFLSGFMAVGKSTLGRRVAAALHRPFYDLDARVTEVARCTIAELFAREGEAAFRAHERLALHHLLTELCVGPPAVIALGGGTVTDAETRRRLRAAGVLVTLSADPHLLRARLVADQSRPLARGADPLALLAARASDYADADVEVPLGVLGIPQATEAILTRLAGLVSQAAPDPPTDAASPAPDVPPGPTTAAGTLEIVLPGRAPFTTPVHFGLGLEAGLVEHLAAHPGSGPVLLVTDAQVAPLHGVRLAARLRAAGVRTHLLVFSGGEGAKTLEVVGQLAAEAIGAGIERGGQVVALGGGVVGDVAGLLAALLLRGLPCVQVPTSLMAQVDSSVGGKTAVNHGGGKNLLGLFAQPTAVFVDVAYLDTLPRREWRAGLAEVIKHAALAEPALLEAAVAVATSAGHASAQTLDVVRRAVAIKARIVALDEREHGIRRWLNLGHTVGHAFEAVHLDRLRHGEAVALGLAVALQLSSEVAGLSAGAADRVSAALRACGLPLDFEAWLGPAVVERVALDKKARGEYVDLVLLEALGQPVIHPMPLAVLQAHLRGLMSGCSSAEKLNTVELSTGE